MEKKECFIFLFYVYVCLSVWSARVHVGDNGCPSRGSVRPPRAGMGAGN